MKAQVTIATTLINQGLLLQFASPNIFLILSGIVRNLAFLENYVEQLSYQYPQEVLEFEILLARNSESCGLHSSGECHVEK